MAGYKNATGGSQSQGDYLMKLMMQQMEAPKKEEVQMIDTSAKA